MEKHLHGATMKHVNRGEFLSTNLYLPLLEEQKRIAEILDHTQSLISKRKEAIAKLDNLTQSIFLEMFGDTESNFKIVKIEDIADKSKYSLFSGSFGSNLTSQHYVSEGVPVLRGLNVTSNRLKLEDLKFISEIKAQELARSELKSGDIVVVAVGASGFAYQFPNNLQRAMMSQNFNKITPDLKKVHGTYLTFCINSSLVQRQILQNVTDTVRTFLSLTKLKKIDIPLPPLPLQKEFAQRVGAVEKLKVTHRASLGELGALFASLQHRAFIGEL
jgi:type I restriction enzyme, S subunit